MFPLYGYVQDGTITEYIDKGDADTSTHGIIIGTIVSVDFGIGIGIGESGSVTDVIRYFVAFRVWHIFYAGSYLVSVAEGISTFI